MAWLAAVTSDGESPLSREQLTKDFVFDGEQIPLVDSTQGIWKPRQLSASLSILTTYRPPGAERPYDDSTGPDGLLRYKWRGMDGTYWVNRALRAAKDRRLPLIWFWGIGQSMYQAVFPVYLIGEEPELQQFVVAIDGLQNLPAAGSPAEEVVRSYVRREIDVRVHQRAFRAMVMRAYENSCAVCALRHPKLLDAAHIVEDRDEHGVAAVRNGLSLCKIHHAAYDTGVLGIDPDRRIHVRADILTEIDGPLLEHGIKALHGSQLRIVPATPAERPDPLLLAQHFEQFLAS